MDTIPLSKQQQTGRVGGLFLHLFVVVYNYRKLTLAPERRHNQRESLSDHAPPDSRNPHLRTPIPPAAAARKPDGLVTLDGVVKMHGEYKTPDRLKTALQTE